jgi:hypothetical protein
VQDDADGNGRDPDADPAPDVERNPNGPTAQPMADAASDADAGTDADTASDADAGTDADAAGDADAEAVEGVDTEHVMNLTFVLTLFIGVPAVVVLSLFVPLEGWNEIIMFVVRVGAAIWFLTAVTLYVRERVRE